MPVSDLKVFFENLPIEDFKKRVAKRLLKEILDRSIHG
jgi:hypothetical protein